MLSLSPESFKSFPIVFNLRSALFALDRMMKMSDNFYAEAMFYQLGAAIGQRPAKAKDAAGVIKQLI
ncbi:MAG: hypothetical protein J6N47_01815, partial [Lachnospiraceae bacterium]|nr:hypothetical protein [Lachnospiraceae bacterium]